MRISYRHWPYMLLKSIIYHMIWLRKCTITFLIVVIFYCNFTAAIKQLYSILKCLFNKIEVDFDLLFVRLTHKGFLAFKGTISFNLIDYNNLESFRELNFCLDNIYLFWLGYILISYKIFHNFTTNKNINLFTFLNNKVDNFSTLNFIYEFCILWKTTL